MATTKLYYFDVYARAEPIRLLLNHAKVTFEDVRLTGADFATFKSEKNPEFGQVPVLEINGEQLSQSAAIIRYIGKQHGYYPEDALAAWKADSIIDAQADLGVALIKAKFEKDAETKETLLKDFFGKVLPALFTVLENRLVESGSKTHIVGSNWTTADFVLASHFFNYHFNEANDFHTQFRAVLETFPELY